MAAPPPWANSPRFLGGCGCLNKPDISLAIKPDIFTCYEQILQNEPLMAPAEQLDQAKQTKQDVEHIA